METNYTPDKPYKTISEVIEELKEIQKVAGDLPMCAFTRGSLTTKIEVYTEPHYYDGGCLFPMENTKYHCKKWGRSRFHGELFPDGYCYIAADTPLGRGRDLIETEKDKFETYEFTK